MSIRVSDLSYTYRTRAQPALDDVSAEFRPGQVTLIAGASGCGKTTLVRCINGLIPRSYRGGAHKGRVTLFGADTAPMSLAQISQVVGTVLQDPEQQIVATRVDGEIAFGLENLGLPRAEIAERVARTADLLHITSLLRRETFSLSGGEKQKVALAGVLAMRPRAILLDEPLALLDPVAGHEALALLRGLAGTGIAVVIIEHRVEDVLAIRPEQCLYMAQGRVTYAGDADGLVQAVDWREIKLPAPVVIRRVAERRRALQKPRGLADAVQPGPPARAPGGEPVRPVPADEATTSRGGGEPLVEYDHVSFRYGGGAEVLSDVSFAIGAGERIAVLGPNGAGKTTLVKHAVGLHKPTRGVVRVLGRDTRGLSVAQAARTVGFVFQSPGHMLFARTVREELSFGPRNLGLSEQAVAEGVAHALAAVSLPGYEAVAPLAMSFGQQKRVSIASILSMSPRLLIMDEPSAGQDYANYTHFMDDIAGAAARPFDAVLFITHDLDLAITYANRVLLVAGGRLIADGSPRQVLQDAETLARCHLLGTSLLAENLRTLPCTGRFLSAPALAEYLSTTPC